MSQSLTILAYLVNFQYLRSIFIPFLAFSNLFPSHYCYINLRITVSAYIYKIQTMLKTPHPYSNSRQDSGVGWKKIPTWPQSHRLDYLFNM